MGAVVTTYGADPVGAWIKMHREMQTVEAWFIRNEDSIKHWDKRNWFMWYSGKESGCVLIVLELKKQL